MKNLKIKILFLFLLANSYAYAQQEVETVFIRMNYGSTSVLKVITPEGEIIKQEYKYDKSNERDMDLILKNEIEKWLLLGYRMEGMQYLTIGPAGGYSHVAIIILTRVK